MAIRALVFAIIACSASALVLDAKQKTDVAAPPKLKKKADPKLDIDPKDKKLDEDIDIDKIEDVGEEENSEDALEEQVEEDKAKANTTAKIPFQDELEKFGMEMQPKPRMNTMHGPDWKQVAARRAATVSALRNQSIIWFGDSLVEHWSGEQQGRPGNQEFKDRAKLWHRFFVARYGASHPSGIGGDRISNMLWRLENGESPNLAQPRVIMLQIGSNDANFGYAKKYSKLPAGEAAKKMFEGYKKIVELFDKESPHSQILLTAIMPRSAEWPNGPFGRIIPAMNKLIETLADQKTIHFSDCSDAMLRQGRIVQKATKDYLHPNVFGSEMWAECLQDDLDRILAV